MTNEQLKKLENDLWTAANSLRAYGGLKAADYALPVLGLIFLKFADDKYTHYEPEILKEFEADKGTRLERTKESVALSRCGFYIPDYARYDELLKLPGDKSLAKALREAMEGIEEHQDEKFKDVLPKEAYFEIEKKKADILPQLLKTFSDIPKNASGDIFGKIYEFFLGEFAMSEGQKGGEFFTPTSVVRLIVEVIEPYAGKIFDPACGSGGMFVQSAKFIQEANHDLNNIYVYGQENMGETARLAKMNLMVNNIRGEITEVNSYESDPYDSLGKFDFVMANPPFNVKSVKENTVKGDERFYKYGLPKNKGKNTDDSISDANYLWISLFASSLNNRGRAGFVMPNSASDASHSEYEIRRNIVDSGIVDCMLSMPSNMFFTVTLPATLWFLDKGKSTTDRKDKILFIDARNTYYQIDRAHREWKEEHIQNLAIIVRLYRGEEGRFLKLVSEYIAKANASIVKLPKVFEALQNRILMLLINLKQYTLESKSKRKAIDQTCLDQSNLLQKLFNLQIDALELPLLQYSVANPQSNSEQKLYTDTLFRYQNKLFELDESIRSYKETVCEIWSIAEKLIKLKGDKKWVDMELNILSKSLDGLQKDWLYGLQSVNYWCSNIHWLQSRFPEGHYNDVVGLCKISDKADFADENDYSLNAARYVGVAIEVQDTTPAEFKNKIERNYVELMTLSSKTKALEYTIGENLKSLL